MTASPLRRHRPPRRAEVRKLSRCRQLTKEILTYTTTPVIYDPGNFYAPDAGRNIFAFYEPPPPTPYSPTPTPPPKPIETPPPPTPTPLPPIMIGFVTPQSVYAGQQTFRLEVNGDKFTPESLIYSERQSVADDVYQSAETSCRRAFELYQRRRFNADYGSDAGRRTLFKSGFDQRAGSAHAAVSIYRDDCPPAF